MRGQAGRPIWIVITLVLALIVGLTMYRLLQKSSPEESIGNLYKTVSGDQALAEVINFCASWYKANFAYGVLDPEKYIKASYAAANKNLDVKYLNDDTLEGGQGLGPCDCVVILYHATKKLGWTVGIDSLELEMYYKKLTGGQIDIPTALPTDWSSDIAPPDQPDQCNDLTDSLAQSLGLAS